MGIRINSVFGEIYQKSILASLGSRGHLPPTPKLDTGCGQKGLERPQIANRCYRIFITHITPFYLKIFSSHHSGVIIHSQDDDSLTALQRLLKFGYLLTHDELFEHTRVLIKPSFNNPIPQISRSWLAKFLIYISDISTSHNKLFGSKIAFQK